MTLLYEEAWGSRFIFGFNFIWIYWRMEANLFKPE